MTAPQFASVGDETKAIKVGDIKLIHDPAVDPAFSVEIQFLNTDGSTDLDKSLSWDGTIWCDANGEDASNQTIPAGQGLWVYNQTYEAIRFQSAGEVNDNDIFFPLAEDGMAVPVGISYPTSITAGNMVLVHDPAVDPAFSVEIQFLNTDGSTDLDKSLSWDGAIWCDVNGEDASNQTIPAGQGLWVYNQTYELINLHIAAPDYK